MSILYAISIVYIAGEYDGPGFCTPIDVFHIISHRDKNIFKIQKMMTTQYKTINTNIPDKEKQSNIAITTERDSPPLSHSLSLSLSLSLARSLSVYIYNIFSITKNI